MSDIQTTLHQTKAGKWVPCNASVRPCPRGNHMKVSGDQKSAAEFFNSLGIQPKSPQGSKSRIPNASVDQIEGILRNTFKGVAVSKRAALAQSLHAELQGATHYDQTQAGYREVYGHIANQIAHVYERENTKGSHNVAARRIFLANGWRTTYGRQVSGYVLRTVTQGEIDRHEERPIYRDRVQEGDILLQGGTYYEVVGIERAKSDTSEPGHPVKFMLNASFTDPSPHTTRTFPIDAVRGTYEII